MNNSPHDPHPPVGGVRFGILGTLEAYEESRPLQLGPLKQRILLGLLLCSANSSVSVAALSDALWDDDPPRTAHKNLQVYVSALRKMIGADAAETDGPRLLHSPPGYVLRIGPDHLDALRFQELARAGRLAARQGETVAGADALGRAVRLWRGPVLPDLVSAGAIADKAQQWHEQYLATYEDWAEATLALGYHTDLVEDVNELVRRHPLRERLRHAQMLALYRSGRQAEALAHFDAMRQLLARELGLRPSPVLARLYESILSGDRSLDVETPGRIPPISLRAPSLERGTLVRDVTDFTGRADHVGTLLGLLNDAGYGGITAISGPAGVGKTALAVHCAHRVAERFPDGRILTCLRAPDGQPRPVSDLLGDLLRGMGLTGALPGGEEERAALLRDSTAGRGVLFVLDDAVTEAQVRSVLSTAGDSVVVVTSRRHLGGLESAVHLVLEPMSEAEAVELLGRLIGPDRAAAEPEMARRLVSACGGLPLAVRIVGAKLAGLRHLTLARYAERLADERRLLDELVAGDLRLRPRLATAYRDLEPDDRATLRCLVSLPDAPFSAGEVAVALGGDVARAEAAIERLIETHVVEVRAHGVDAASPVDVAGSGADALAARLAEVEAHAAGREARYALPALIRVFVRERSEGDSLYTKRGPSFRVSGADGPREGPVPP